MTSGPRLEYRGVYEPFEIERALVVADRLPVEAELGDVRGGDQFRGDRAGDQKPARVVRMPDADMAVGVDHRLPREDAIGDHQILDKGVEAAHGRDPIGELRRRMRVIALSCPRIGTAVNPLVLR